MMPVTETKSRTLYHLISVCVPSPLHRSGRNKMSSKSSVEQPLNAKAVCVSKLVMTSCVLEPNNKSPNGLVNNALTAVSLQCSLD